MHRAEVYLHRLWLELHMWRGSGPRAGLDDLVAKALGAVDALRESGLLSADQAAEWRERFRSEPDEPPAAGESLRATGERLMEELLAEIGRDPEWDSAELNRFEGALDALVAVRSGVDRVAWDGRLRERAGWPSAEQERAEERALNAGGTQAQLLEVLAGPPERRAGLRVLLVLRFADGLVFLVDGQADGASDEGWLEWRLQDDRGDEFVYQGGGGGDGDHQVAFRGAVSPETRWLELEANDGARFRVSL